MSDNLTNICLAFQHLCVVDWKVSSLLWFSSVETSQVRWKLKARDCPPRPDSFQQQLTFLQSDCKTFLLNSQLKLLEVVINCLICVRWCLRWIHKLGATGEAVHCIYRDPPLLTPVPDRGQPRQPPAQQQHGVRGGGRYQGGAAAQHLRHWLCERQLGARIPWRQTVCDQSASQQLQSGAVLAHGLADWHHHHHVPLNLPATGESLDSREYLTSGHDAWVLSPSTTHLFLPFLSTVEMKSCCS